MSGKDMLKAGAVGAGIGLVALAGYHGVKKLANRGNSTNAPPAGSAEKKP
jgi:hypothetical protein